MIRNIWAVGRNYLEHAQEMGEKTPLEPLFFLKAGSCVAPTGSKIHLPSFSKDVQYEVEIALIFNEQLQVDRAAIAIDLTARDIQKNLKMQGSPWTLSKSFKQACPLGPAFSIQKLNEISDFIFDLTVNGAVRQSGAVSEMLFSPEELVNYLLSRFPVCPNDVLLTGTPKGVSQAHSKDRVKARIIGHTEADWTII